MNAEEYSRMFQMEEEHWYFRGKRRIVRELLRPLSGASRLAILDAGCGTGGMLRELRRLGNPCAIDPFPEAVDCSVSRGFTCVAQASVDKLPFSDNSFDLVTSFDVIEHVDDDRQALREMNRVLRPGGLLLLTVPACMLLWSGHDVALHHKRRYSEAELRGKVMGAGFRIVRCTSFNTVLFPIVAAVRVLRRLLGRDRVTSDTSEMTARPINSLLCQVLGLEALLLRYLNFPIGVSLACIARKEEVR